MTMPQQRSSGVILVEGQDDKHVLVNLCKHRPDLFQISDSSRHERLITSNLSGKTLRISEKHGKKDVLDALREEPKTEAIETLGVILDADQNFEQTSQKVTAALQKNNIIPPPTFPEKRLIIPANPEDTPRIGIWIMPDNKSPGELEDFLFQMIREDNPTWPSAKTFITEIPEAEREFNSNKTPKAQLYAWLATLKEPARMGAAINKGKTDDQNPLFLTFIAWLHELLE